MSEFALNAPMRGFDANGELRPHQSEAPHSYKETPLGWIPKEWDVLALGDIASSIIDGPFGSNLKTEHYVADPGVRVVRLQNIQQGEYDDSDRAFISEQHAAALARNCVTGGDVLIASLGDDNYPVGRACCYPMDLPDAVNKADCFRLRAGNRCRNEFVMLFMNSAAARKQIRQYEQGVTMKRINLGNLRKIMIAVPTISEQDIIIARMSGMRSTVGESCLHTVKTHSPNVGVMDTLGTAIRDTQTIISKLKVVKQGLLHDLLTRGIDANGELRPPQSEAPHLYKQSPLGWIPKAWTAKAIKNSIDLICGQHIPAQLCNEVGKGVPYFTGPADFFNNSTRVSRYTTHPQVMCKDGDILLTVKGSGCGKAAVAAVDACISRQLTAVRASQEASHFFFMLFQSLQGKLNRLATGGNIPGISREQILELLVALPNSEDEMRFISEYAKELEDRIDCEIEKLVKLKHMKSGLMDDLLTGRVSVTPLLEQAGESLLSGGK